MLRRLLILLTAVIAAGRSSAAQQPCDEQRGSPGADSVVNPDGSIVHYLRVGKIWWPPGPPRLVRSEENPKFQYYRDILSIEFRPGLSAQGVRQFVLHFRAEPIGSFGGDVIPLCVFRFPDPGTRWSDLLDLSARLRAYPGVRMAVEMSYGALLDLD
jgi:hypothetical protein